MSEANRRKMYDELVAEKRFKDIDPGLIKEFGEAKRPEPEKQIMSENFKKRLR
jgi:hypothetical protein